MFPVLRKLLPVALAFAIPTLYSADVPKLTDEQIETFLKNAKVVKIKELSTGITHTQRATLSDSDFQHDAHVQSIDEAKAMFQGDRGSEMNFRDTWKFNVAAYRLDRLLSINMTPPSVERNIGGKSSAVTWWLEETMMETDRLKKKLSSDDKDGWNRQMHVVRVFDQLIFNTDRNLQNLLIDKQWQIWMIDHTRAFRLHTTLRTPKDLVLCDRQLLAKLRELDTNKLSVLKPYVTDLEIKGLLGRRDKIVAFFDAQIKAKGESAVLYDHFPR